MSLITSHLLSTAVILTRIKSADKRETDMEDKQGANCFLQGRVRKKADDL